MDVERVHVLPSKLIGYFKFYFLQLVSLHQQLELKALVLRRIVVSTSLRYDLQMYFSLCISFSRVNYLIRILPFQVLYLAVLLTRTIVIFIPSCLFKDSFWWLHKAQYHILFTVAEFSQVCSLTRDDNLVKESYFLRYHIHLMFTLIFMYTMCHSFYRLDWLQCSNKYNPLNMVQ